MNLPIQSAPIARGHTGTQSHDGIHPSGGNACVTACRFVPGLAKLACCGACGGFGCNYAACLAGHANCSNP